MLTVLLIVHNEMENLKLSVESFRLFCDTEISLVIIDDHSSDGLQEWAKEQTDLTYVWLDEGYVSPGKAINIVRRELGIDTDILTMESHYLLLPGYLSRLKELLCREDETGAVCGVICNADKYEANVLEDYNAAIKMVNSNEEARGERALLPYNSAVLWKKSAIDALGDFEEETESLYAATDDYCIRMIKSGQKIMVCRNAFLWSIVDRRIQYAYLSGGDRYLEKKWGMHYFNRNGNMHLIELLEARPEDEFTVLEIGCDCGATLLEIRNKYPKAKIYGSEINKAAAAIASHVAEVMVNNIEEKNLPFPEKKFDYIIFGDVLEHLRDPLDVLFYCRELLCEGGSVIASIPNVMHISVVEQLMKGNFTYTESGLLDKTHIHLFTYNEIIRMFTKAGYQICNINSVCMEMSGRQKRLIDGLLALEDNAERWMYETFQYNVKVKVK